MPRPGPRPYECVRRAWHSDRHQPIRGSIVQQIFRVVNETHSAATRKNKEWQEKLPIVVLKAEEILYSKANSEAEYSNVETLWDRVNDAINTIIRRDESSETGDLLPPCIEAALNLGCVPLRASRSQRHSNPRSYLNLKVHEPVSQPPRVLDKPSSEWHQQSVVHSGNPLSLERATLSGNVAYPLLESDLFRTEDHNFANNRGYSFLYENVPPCQNELMRNTSNKHLNIGSVYPLYYGNRCLAEGSQLVSEVQEKTNTKTIFVGKPVHMALPERSGRGVLQNLFPCSTTEIASKRIRQEEGSVNDVPAGDQCDLSLRLGLSEFCTNNEKCSAQETEDVDLRYLRDRGKLSDCSLRNNKEFQVFFW